MLSQRQIAQIGILATAAVFVTSIGVLISQGGDNSQNGASGTPAQVIKSDSQGAPLTLSAPANSSSASAAQR